MNKFDTISCIITLKYLTKATSLIVSDMGVFELVFEPLDRPLRQAWFCSILLARHSTQPEKKPLFSSIYMPLIGCGVKRIMRECLNTTVRADVCDACREISLPHHNSSLLPLSTAMVLNNGTRILFLGGLAVVGHTPALAVRFRS